jgi:hypothetical protein
MPFSLQSERHAYPTGGSILPATKAGGSKAFLNRVRGSTPAGGMAPAEVLGVSRTWTSAARAIHKAHAQVRRMPGVPPFSSGTYGCTNCGKC